MTTDLNILDQVAKADANVKLVETQLFKVAKLPLRPRFVNQLKFKPLKNVYGIYKTTGGEALGVMGSIFVPMQPSEFLENIVETVRDYGADLDLSTLKFREFCGGSKIEFSIEIEPLVFENNRQKIKNKDKDVKLQDVTSLYLTFTTSYDGSKPNVISLYTRRLVCKNGMVASKLEGTLKGRNTMNGKAKILSYGQEVAEIVNGAKDFKEKMIELDKIKLTKKQVEEFKLKLLGFNAESLAEKGKTHYKNEELLKHIDESIKLEFARTGQTAYGLLQGITYYTNHVANANSKKYSSDEYIRFNQGVKTNNKAQEILFAMIEPKKGKKVLEIAN